MDQQDFDTTEAAQGCGGTTPLCFYDMDITKVEGTTSTFCARYRFRGIGAGTAK
jgi:hypothetical protein